MKIGNFKFGNDYKFDMKDVVRKEREDIGTLDKIELRYNTRRNLPSYPAMKSLYRWRSVFGYRLGGILRQAVVKLAEVKRPIVNAHTLLGKIADGRLHTYKRLYSSRAVMKAVQSANPGASQVKMLKYFSFGQIPDRMHGLASNSDHSVRNTIMRKFMAVSQNNATKHFFEQQNKEFEAYNKNKPTNGIDLPSNRPNDMKLHNVDSEMKKIKDQKSDLQMRWEDKKERIAYKARYQKERFVNFFSEWKGMGLKEAYSRMVDRSKDDEQHYQSRFNHKSDFKPQDTDNPTIKLHTDDYYIGLYGEKVVKDSHGGEKPQEDRLREPSDNLPPLNTKAYPWHLEDLAEYNDKLRDRLAEIRKNLGMEKTNEVDI